MSKTKTPRCHESMCKHISTILFGDEYKAYNPSSMPNEIKSMMREIEILRYRVEWLQNKCGIEDGRP